MSELSPLPSSEEYGSTIDLQVIAQQLGIPQELTKYEREFDELIYFSTAEAFLGSEGGYAIGIDYPDPRFVEFFGQTRLEQGSVPGRLVALYEQERNNPDAMVHRLMRFVAWGLAKRGVADEVEPNTIIEKSLNRILLRYGVDEEGELVFCPEELRRTPEVVIDCGPGIRGCIMIDTQLSDIQRAFNQETNVEPFKYITLTKDSFIDSLLEGHLYRRLWGLGPEGGKHIRQSFYSNIATGMATGSSSLIERAGDDPQMADLMMLSAVHTAGARDIETTIHNSYALLKPDGALLLRSLLQPYCEKNWVSIEAMVKMASEAGYDVSKANPLQTRTANSRGEEAVGETYILFK